MLRKLALSVLAISTMIHGAEVEKSQRSEIVPTESLEQSDEVSTLQAAVNKIQANMAKKNAVKSKTPFSQVLDFTLNTDARETNDGDKGYDNQVWYFLKYKINDDYTARLWIDIKKDLANSYEEKLKDTKITLFKKGWELTDSLKLSPSITVVLPTSETSKRNEQMNFGLQFNPSFRYIVNEKISLGFLPRVVKNFHEYTTSRTNKVNTEYKLLQFYSADYTFSEKWSVGALLIYVNSWSYKGTQKDPGYFTSLELGYSVNKKISLAVGTGQGGSIFAREEGPDENISLYNKNETSLYGKLVLKF